MGLIKRLIKCMTQPSKPVVYCDYCGGVIEHTTNHFYFVTSIKNHPIQKEVSLDMKLSSELGGYVCSECIKDLVLGSIIIYKKGKRL